MLYFKEGYGASRLGRFRHSEVNQATGSTVPYSILHNLCFPVAASVAGLLTVLRLIPSRSVIENTTRFIDLFFSVGCKINSFPMQSDGFAILLSMPRTDSADSQLTPEVACYQAPYSILTVPPPLCLLTTMNVPVSGWRWETDSLTHGGCPDMRSALSLCVYSFPFRVGENERSRSSTCLGLREFCFSPTPFISSMVMAGQKVAFSARLPSSIPFAPLSRRYSHHYGKLPTFGY